MKIPKYARPAALLTATLLLGVGCTAPVDPGDDQGDEAVATPDESTGEAQQAFTNWFWTLDNYYGWSWKVSYSFYYRRWMWNYCYGYNSGYARWLWCYSAAPYNPEDSSRGVNNSAPRPSGSGPANPPAGAPTTAPSGNPPANPPPGA